MKANYADCGVGVGADQAIEFTTQVQQLTPHLRRLALARFSRGMSLLNVRGAPRGGAFLSPMPSSSLRIRPVVSRISAQRAMWCALLLTALPFAPKAGAQGCVAIKQMDNTTCSMEDHTEERWQMGLSYEHFRSHRHYVGRDEQTQRRANGSEVVNMVDQFDLTLSYRITSRTSATLGVPYFTATRTSLYEHDRVNRYRMSGRGLGDIRVTTTRWFRDPASNPANNLALTLGIKAPTGDTNVKDYAHTTTGLRLRNVDQSIQPGDGGWGVIVGGQAFQRITDTTSLYANGFYLINPRETNGTRTTSSNPVTAYNSVPDQFQARIGASQLISRKRAVTGSFGFLWEAVPSSDLIGGDKGFRRPGYVISIEPGLSFEVTRHDSFSLSVPIALIRDRVRSYADKLSGGHGDAAFADFLINASYVRRW